MYASVLVALDGSQLAAEAIPHGVAIARQFGARLILLRVVPPDDDLGADESGVHPSEVEASSPVPGRRDRDALRSQAEGYLAGLKRLLVRQGINVEVVVREGKPAEVILDQARSIELPMVVITTYGKRFPLSPPECALGSVTEEVLRSSTAPVLVVRPAAGASP